MITKLSNHGNEIDLSRQRVCKYSGGQCILHMAFERKHLAKYTYTIHCFGHELDGKQIIKESSTSISKIGNFGKSKSTFYLNEINSPMFDTIKDFENHYKLI